MSLPTEAKAVKIYIYILLLDRKHYYREPESKSAVESPVEQTYKLGCC
jgi:hypothetical protein